MDTLQTERLTIRPFVMDGLEQVHQFLDLEIQWAGPSFSCEQRAEKLQLYVALANWDDKGRIYGNRAIIHRESERMVGMCGLHPTYGRPTGRPFSGRSCSPAMTTARRIHTLHCSWEWGTRSHAIGVGKATPQRQCGLYSPMPSQSCKCSASWRLPTAPIATPKA